MGVLDIVAFAPNFSFLLVLEEGVAITAPVFPTRNSSKDTQWGERPIGIQRSRREECQMTALIVSSRHSCARRTGAIRPH